MKNNQTMNLVRSGMSLMGLLSLSIACGSPEGTDVGVNAEHRKVVKGGKDWGCRDCGFTNSPYLGPYAFESVGYGSLPGPSLNKFVEAIDVSGAAWPVFVDEFGLGVDQGGLEVRGHDLVGWTLIVDASNATGSDTYEVEVYAFEEVAGWNDSEDPVPTYGLSVYDVNTDTMVNVCPGYDLDATSIVFLDRELYDLSTFGVDDGVDNVASLACRGHALAKMKLLQYDPNSPSFSTTPSERLATLRMLTADYCGDGTSQTWVGTPLDWTDQLGHVLFDPSSMSPVIEAEWSEDGALCLNTPRVGSAPSCSPALPPCDPLFSAVSGDAVWTTMLP